MRPVIGITAGHSKNEYDQATVLLADAYVQAVVGAGGFPLIVPSDPAADAPESIYSRVDGVLFSGGGDIAPERFRAEEHPRIADVEPARDQLEFQLLQRAVAEGKPFLGICRGFQVVNVGLGGTLYTHIPDQLPGALRHDNPGNKRHDLIHAVALEKTSRIRAILGETSVQVNSHHHQGIRKLAPGLRAAGNSADGLIEAVELPDHPFGVAVQWHPEWLTDMAPTRHLFASFIEACASSRA